MLKGKSASLLVVMFTAIGLIMVGSVFAYLTSRTLSLGNAFLVPDFGVEIVENPQGADPPPTPDELEIQPKGDTAVKEVHLTNTGSMNAFVRATLVPVFRVDEKEAVNGEMHTSRGGNLDYSKIDSGIITYTYKDPADRTEKVYAYELRLHPDWKTDWLFEPTQNIFYYRHVLAPGAMTSTPLLEKVVHKTNDWADFEIEVLCDGIQSYQAGDGKPSLEYAGWNAYVKEKTIDGKTQLDLV